MRHVSIDDDAALDTELARRGGGPDSSGGGGVVSSSASRRRRWETSSRDAASAAAAARNSWVRSVLLVSPVVRCGSLIVSVLVAVASTVLFAPRLLLHSLLQRKDAEAPAGELDREDGEIAPQRGRRLAPPRPPQFAVRCRGD